MRYKIWLALIICGTIIVLAQPLSDYLANHRSPIHYRAEGFNRREFWLVADVSQYVLGRGSGGMAMILVVDDQRFGESDS